MPAVERFSHVAFPFITIKVTSLELLIIRIYLFLPTLAVISGLGKDNSRWS